MHAMVGQAGGGSEGTVVVAGLGNIGSQTILGLARLPEVRRMILVDPDSYEASNLNSQAIGPEAVGLPKVVAAAESLRRLRPDLEVWPLQNRVEFVPWGRLRAKVVLGCLDSKAARRELNRLAGRLGAHYVDAGVAGPSLLARVSVFPATAGVCLECGWSQADYEQLEVAFSCQGGEVRAAETRSPAYLGQLAASLQVAESHRLLAEQGPGGAGGDQAFELLLDAGNHRFFRSRLTPSPGCRFSHGAAVAELLREHPAEVSLARVLEGAAGLEAEGDVFVRDLVCPGCGRQEPVLVRRRALRESPRFCQGCGEEMLALGFTMREVLEPSMLVGDAGGVSLAGAGFEPGDIFRVFRPASLTTGVVAHYWEIEIANKS